MQLIHDIVVLETNDGSLFYYTYICMYGHNNFPEYDSMHYVPLSWYTTYLIQKGILSGHYLSFVLLF